jgi:tetratricopeptide (TPR) repeat protein
MDKSPGQRMAMSSPATKTYFARRPWLLGLILVVVTFAVYFPSLRGGFVFDDLGLIKNNRLVHASDGLHRFWFTTEAPDYYPLTWSLLWLEWHLWGASPLGYHVVNLLLHAANAVLVWTVLTRLRVPGAWLAALIFAIHPVNVATGAWISEQKSTLSMFFYALAILFYLRFEEERRWRSYGLALAAFLLALFSKTAIVMLPVVLLGCVWWQRGRLQLKDLLWSVPFFALSLVSGLVTIWFQYEHVLKAAPVRAVGFMGRLAAAGRVPWFYLYKALLPVNLMLIYPQWEINASHLVSYMPGMILIAILIFFWSKRKTCGRGLFFGLGYFVVMLFPVLGFFEQSFYRLSLVADHWQYYSIIGVIALVVAGGERVCRRIGDPGRSVGVMVSVAMLIVLGMGTWKRSGVYANEETLWSDNVAKAPNAWAAHYNLGIVFARLGRVPEAIGQYEQALRIRPDFADAGNNLAWLLATHEGSSPVDHARAVQLAKYASQSADGKDPGYLDTLAAAYAANGRFLEAIATAQKTIELARTTMPPQRVRKMEARLELYRAGRPYSESATATSPPTP